MESLGDIANRFNPQERAQREAERRAAMPDCEDHPGNKRPDCQPCKDDQRRRDLAERFREVVDDATRTCDDGFPLRYRTARADHPEVARWVKEFQADPREAPSLLLLGPTGVGKTWQAYGALRAAATHPQPAQGVGYRRPSWMAMTFADLNASLRPRSNVDTEAVLERYRLADLLLVDDLGLAKTSEWVEETTYRLLNGRYEQMRPSIFTSNFAVDQLRDNLGDRIASRLSEICTRVVMAGSDRRRRAA